MARKDNGRYGGGDHSRHPFWLTDDEVILIGTALEGQRDMFARSANEHDPARSPFEGKMAREDKRMAKASDRVRKKLVGYQQKRWNKEHGYPRSFGGQEKR